MLFSNETQLEIADRAIGYSDANNPKQGCARYTSSIFGPFRFLRVSYHRLMTHAAAAASRLSQNKSPPQPSSIKS